MKPKPGVVGMGEVLWDLLPAGRHLGGAPANFACHAAALGAEARLVSRLGDDPLGREALEELSALGLVTDCVEVDPRLPTGTVSVEVDAGGQPRFTIHEGAAWDAMSGGAASQRAVAAAQAVCFGTLAQRDARSRAAIRSLLAASPASAWRMLDVNLRQHYYSQLLIEESLALANAIKLNEAELPRLAEMLELAGDERAQIGRLAARFGLRCVVYTRGGRGSVLLVDGQWSDHPGTQVKVVDTIGAGDSFTAAVVLGLLAGWRLDLVHHRASELAAFVCSQAGATPQLPERLRAPFLER
jgi:fructokinase